MYPGEGSFGRFGQDYLLMNAQLEGKDLSFQNQTIEPIIQNNQNSYMDLMLAFILDDKQKL